MKTTGIVVVADFAVGRKLHEMGWSALGILSTLKHDVPALDVAELP